MIDFYGKGGKHTVHGCYGINHRKASKYICRKSHFHCIHKTYSFWLRFCCQCHFCFLHGDRSNLRGLQVAKIIGQHRMPHIYSFWDVRVQKKARDKKPDRHQNSSTSCPVRYYWTYKKITFPDQTHRTLRKFILAKTHNFERSVTASDPYGKWWHGLQGLGMAGFFGTGSFCWKPFLENDGKGEWWSNPIPSMGLVYLPTWMGG